MKVTLEIDLKHHPFGSTFLKLFG